jgi:uncharacterized protein with HEPN domain
MSKRDEQVSIRDMLSHASEAVELLGTASRTRLGRDRVVQLALTRLVEIIGEAANRVSDATRQKHPKIPWPRSLVCATASFMDTTSLTTNCSGTRSVATCPH